MLKKRGNVKEKIKIVIEEYITNPLLLWGKKFDFRVFVM